MSRVELAKIPALTFYQDALTSSRRTSPLPQLVCVGKPCRQFTPEVVRCVNLGGVGTEIDWKCEADLPESLRFGRVGISCEGWSKPGDPYVLKGSCSLEYRLVKIPKTLMDDPERGWFKTFGTAEQAFTIVWIAFLLFILYGFLKSCLRRNHEPGQTSYRPSPNYRPGGGGWFPGGPQDSYTDPPPPYPKQPSEQPGQNWRPGFWTGATLGGLGTYLMSNRRPIVNTERWSGPWDWEERVSRRPIFSGRRSSASSEDRGEGPSNLGGMRRSTGLGGTTVR